MTDPTRNAVARALEHERDVPGETVFALPPRRPLVLKRGDRCPGCWVVCNSLDTEHLDGCFYQGRNAAILEL